MKRYKILFITTVLFFSLAGLVQASNLQQAFGMDPGDDFYKAVKGAGYNPDEAVFDKTIANIINAALSLVGVIFLVLMVYGGFLWMTARGNEQQVEKAKNLIIAAIIGLVIVISAYAISVFVVSKLGQATLESSQTTP